MELLFTLLFLSPLFLLSPASAAELNTTRRALAGPALVREEDPNGEEWGFRRSTLPPAVHVHDLPERIVGLPPPLAGSGGGGDSFHIGAGEGAIPSISVAIPSISLTWVIDVKLQSTFCVLNGE